MPLLQWVLAEDVQERSKHVMCLHERLLGASRPTRNQTVRDEQNDRAQDGHNEPYRITSAVPADSAAEEAADDGTHDAEKDRHNEAGSRPGMKNWIGRAHV